MHVLTAVMTVITACQPTAPGPEAKRDQAAPPVPARTTTPAIEATGRRDRAGIDRGEGSDSSTSAKATKATRVPAAEFIVTTPPAAVPAFDGGARSPAATGALNWLKGTWANAVLQDDSGVYTALLHDDFKGHSATQPTLITRDEWAKTRLPTLGTKLVWGLEYVTANPNIMGRLSVRMIEAHEGETGCVFSTRTLNLQPLSVEDTKGWQLTSEERSKVSPCPTTTVRDAIGAHTALGIAWRSRDLTAVQKAIYGGFVLLDGGVESAQYNHAGLTAGAGRWVLEEVATTVATPHNTQLIGDTAVVMTTDGSRFGYQIAAGTWRLTTLWRATAQGR
jgi:hypothetical protein